jgi:hypothetical protein
MRAMAAVIAYDGRNRPATGDHHCRRKPASIPSTAAGIALNYAYGRLLHESVIGQAIAGCGG